MRRGHAYHHQDRDRFSRTNSLENFTAPEQRAIDCPAVKGGGAGGSGHIEVFRADKNRHIFTPPKGVTRNVRDKLPSLRGWQVEHREERDWNRIKSLEKRFVASNATSLDPSRAELGQDDPRSLLIWFHLFLSAENYLYRFPLSLTG
ncbi:hypothetical protein COT44_00115 [Candidatus Shapirobacteria bacterium CG08_land_8_20_14_0_20_39_18]|uniref:Uncharacterized protein n=1 Tax=Candidatus Shapirobacteria bacterium CG08_land_8_20_14_0_20_39_18 TaxID=1974883 RepID=A0A2M6XEF4_9BACT|nr:MAG: hypothetical protein COT44_00115 [Candidatus Shapirobacteria bacterium CG08_land_8_20_14_0_20_39_18]PIY66106.1 MAG: hypothetical protein COY91_01385 [Candidatus Shapirobacteria bacterium CG_4_10_14_0_8_um_filter_39_15]PJE68660.1 MAG: hypothetical protein COU94_00940 [Candidatus Shapirobacteria bacterium CG10_big_fil_rev_8_21_14_0_10_38_8]